MTRHLYILPAWLAVLVAALLWFRDSLRHAPVKPEVYIGCGQDSLYAPTVGCVPTTMVEWKKARPAHQGIERKRR